MVLTADNHRSLYTAAPMEKGRGDKKDPKTSAAPEIDLGRIHSHVEKSISRALELVELKQHN